MATATRTSALPRRSGPPIAPRKPMVSESGVNVSSDPPKAIDPNVSGVKKTQLGVAPSLPPPIEVGEGQKTLALTDEQLAQARGLRDEGSGERVRAEVSPMTQRMPSLEDQSGEKRIETAPLAKPIVPNAAPLAATMPLEKPLADLIAKKLSEGPKDGTLAMKPSGAPPALAGTSVMPPRPASKGPSPIPAPRTATPGIAMAPVPALPLVDSYATNKQQQHRQQPSAPPPPMQAQMQAQPIRPMQSSMPPPLPPQQQGAQMLSRPPPPVYSRPPPAALSTGPNPPSADPSEGDRPTFHVYSPHEIQSRQRLPTLTGIAEIPVVTPMHKMTGLKILGVVAAVCLVIGTVAAGIAVASEDKPAGPPPSAVAAPTTAPTVAVTAPNAPATVAPPSVAPPAAGVKPLKPIGKPVKPSGAHGNPPSGPLPGNPYGK